MLPQRPTKSWAKAAIFVSCLMVSAAVVLRAKLWIALVHNRSMSPTLEDGDRVLVVRGWPVRFLRRGQVVVVATRGKLATSASSGRSREIPYIKRLVGLPGESLVTSLDDLHVRVRTGMPRALHDAEGKRYWTIPAGHYFVRGDYTPSGGADSLTWGPIPARDILGLVVLKLPRKA